MLSAAQNRRLTETGAGTPMGDLMRRYWHPIAGVTEFDDASVRPVRLMGEDLVLYKDLSGQYGLVQRQCPHRNADLLYGYVEQCGLRCSYHGWQFDAGGQCLHQPFEEVVDPAARMRRRTRITAYPVREKAGMLWAYLGPAPAPELPDWDLFNYPHGFVQVVISEIPCNWLQCQENSIDPIHFEWTHNNWMQRQRNDLGPYVPTHLKIDFDEFEFGLIYKRLRAGEREDGPMWQVGRVALWPNGFYLGSHFEWRVPIDDENTLSVLWVYNRLPNDRDAYVQDHIPTWHAPIRDPDTGRWLTSHVMNQDIVAWVGQGRITDRRREHLGASDRGVILMRRRLLEQMDRLAEGIDPPGVIRDPARNRDIVLPSICREDLLAGMTYEELRDHPVLGANTDDFMFHAGQPPEVREAYLDALGRRPAVVTVFNVHGARSE